MTKKKTCIGHTGSQEYYLYMCWVAVEYNLLNNVQELPVKAFAGLLGGMGWRTQRMAQSWYR